MKFDTEYNSSMPNNVLPTFLSFFLLGDPETVTDLAVNYFCLQVYLGKDNSIDRKKCSAFSAVSANRNRFVE